MHGLLLPLLTGAILGLSVAAPFGPIALLCMQRSIAMGAWLGLVTGLGAASVHVVYSTVAIAGTGVVAAELARWGQPVRLVSCALLIVLGIRVLLRRAPSVQSSVTIRAPAAFATSFAVGLLNPLTIVPYLLVATGAAASAAASVAGSVAAGPGMASGMAAAPLTLWSVPGVFLGAMAWYSVISGGAALFRSALKPGAIRRLNQAAGAMLIGFGVLTACR